MEKNIKAILEYEGTAYHGWQYQVNAVSIQDTLEKAIFSLLGKTIRVTAAGRTDAGVHARGQVINFRIHTDFPIKKIAAGLNAHLPDDIVIKSTEQVEETFNARFSAKKRIYQYYISAERTALTRTFCWQFFQKLDTRVLDPLAELLLGKHDFGAFSRIKVQSSHKECMVYESCWRYENRLWIYRITANRFLHGMVRTLVGTMVDVARGRLSIADFQRIFSSRNRLLAGAAAPAKGLVLEEVIY